MAWKQGNHMEERKEKETVDVVCGPNAQMGLMWRAEKSVEVCA